MMTADQPRTFIDPAQQATEKQWAFVRSLAQQVVDATTDENKRRISETILGETTREENSKKSASALIDMLKQHLAEDRAAAREQKAAGADAEAPEGIHIIRHAGEPTVLKVQVAHHGSGRKYAKRLNTETGEFEYVGRAPLSELSEATLMTLEQAKKFGHLYGMCCRCGATLTDEGSIAAGIGPVCATKF